MRRVLAWLAGGVLVLLAVLLLGAGPALDSGLARRVIVQAIERATGHEARIDGPVELSWGMSPQVRLHDLVLLNPAGFTGPDLARIGLVAARIELLPLLAGRLVVPQARAEQGLVAFARNASGAGNWERAGPAGPAPAEPPTVVKAGQGKARVELGTVEITDVRVTGPGMPPITLADLTVHPSGGAVTGDMRVNGEALKIDGFADAMADRSPFLVSAVGAGITAWFRRDPGGQPQLLATMADLDGLGRMLGQRMPPLRDMIVNGSVADGLHLVAQAGDLSAYLPGWGLVRLEASWAGPGKPIMALAQTSLRDLPVGVALALGPFAAATPVSLELTADGGTAALVGSVTASAFDGTVTASLPDLARAGGLAGIALPPLKDVALTVRARPGQAGSGLVLRGLRLTSAQGDLAGDLALEWGARPSLRGSLVSQKLDLAGWQPAAPPQSVASPSPSPTPAPPLPAKRPEAPPGWVIPDRPLPFDLLDRADADLHLAIGQLLAGHAAYRAVDAHVVLSAGRLRLEPGMTVAAGAVRGEILADARAVPPTASVKLVAPGVEAGLLGLPGLSGTMDLDVDLHAAGATWHDLASTLDGHLAGALADGAVANEALAALFGAALRDAGVPLDAAGSSRVKCLALRLEAVHGVATLETLALDTTRLRLEGEGVANLAAETMDLHLRPVLRFGANGVTVPMRLSGPFRGPKAAADKGVMAPGRFGLGLGAIAGDGCGPALTAIRQGIAVR